jgi:hypothetical protein
MFYPIGFGNAPSNVKFDAQLSQSVFFTKFVLKIKWSFSKRKNFQFFLFEKLHFDIFKTNFVKKTLCESSSKLKIRVWNAGLNESQKSTFNLFERFSP